MFLMKKKGSDFFTTMKIKSEREVKAMFLDQDGLFMSKVAAEYEVYKLTSCRVLVETKVIIA